VKQDMEIPDGSFVVGVPARIVRPLTEEERAMFKPGAEKYAANAAYCLKHKINVQA